MTIQQAAESALALQDGVNLSGIAHTLARICSEALWPEARRLNEGTKWVNQHPILTVLLDKLTDLNADSSRDVFAAYIAVEHIAKGTPMNRKAKITTPKICAKCREPITSMNRVIRAKDGALFHGRCWN